MWRRASHVMVFAKVSSWFWCCHSGSSSRFLNATGLGSRAAPSTPTEIAHHPKSPMFYGVTGVVTAISLSALCGGGCVCVCD